MWLPAVPPIDAELVLQADHVDVAEVQKIGGAVVAVELLLRDFEAHFRRIVVALGLVVDGDDGALRLRIVADDTALSKSSVKVAMPQRRGT